MEIFGLSPVELTLIICIVGISLRTYIGYVRTPNTKLSINAIIASFMVGIVISVGLVAPVIDALPNDSTQIVMLVAVTGQIIVVMKSESIARAAQDILQLKINSTNKTTKDGI